MSSLITLRSKLDASVNFVSADMFEARYVRRAEHYFIAYLSSQSGCAQGCTMCHLTTTGQTVPVNANWTAFSNQLDYVCHEYKTQSVGLPEAKLMHINFMARGEPLANPYVDGNLLNALANRSFQLHEVKALPRFLVSTIMPKQMLKQGSLSERFSLVQPEICYSLYSTDAEFRKKWLPSALPVNDALKMLVDWQSFSQKLVKIHFPLIKGQNDDIHSLMDVCLAIKASGLRVNFNLVQYNPPNSESESATDEAYDLAKLVFQRQFPESRVQIVPKVGYDVKASCGMFVEKSVNVS